VYLLIALVLLAPSTARTLECGDVLVEDAVLDRDLDCSAGDGLVIGADGITIDLGGHALAGSEAPGSAGIRNEGHNAVRIFDGLISGFEIGVVVSGVKHCLLTSLTIAGNAGEGILLTESSRNVVAENEVSFNVDPGEIRLVASHRNWVVRNSLHGGADTGPAIALESSDHNRVLGNFTIGHDDACILLRDSHRNRVRFNEVGDSNGSCILIDRSNHNRIADNRLFRSEASAIEVVRSDGNRVARNVAENGNGLRVFSSTRTLLWHNFISRASNDGIRVEGGSIRTRVLHNILRANEDDGIDVRDAGTVIADNRAFDNDDYGVEAVPGVIDGGGNRASGNGNPGQCLNVRCK
jgi:parallel beta-helix repeat protein